MFVVVQFPLADLRSLVKDQMGRLAAPDWTADHPGETFVRGFGPIAIRNKTSYEGLLGERYFADFDRAARFRRKAIDYRHEGSPRELHIQPWFRRFYFDGFIAGRFEFGFVTGDTAEDLALGNQPVDPRTIAGAIGEAALLIKGNDLPDENTNLARAFAPLGMAYLAATTRKGALAQYPLAETHGVYVEVGPPVFHLRMSDKRDIDVRRDGEWIRWNGRELLLTTATDQQRRRNVIIQQSARGAFEESPDERAVRVLFSHLNSLIFALSKLISATHDKPGEFPREQIRKTVATVTSRLSTFKPTGPTNEGDTAFADAITAFANSYVGRIDELTVRLQALASEVAKPTTVESALAYLKSLFELIVGKAVEAGVKSLTKIGSP